MVSIQFLFLFGALHFICNSYKFHGFLILHTVNMVSYIIETSETDRDINTHRYVVIWKINYCLKLFHYLHVYVYACIVGLWWEWHCKKKKKIPKLKQIIYTLNTTESSHKEKTSITCCNIQTTNWWVSCIFFVCFKYQKLCRQQKLSSTTAEKKTKTGKKWVLVCWNIVPLQAWLCIFIIYSWQG